MPDQPQHQSDAPDSSSDKISRLRGNDYPLWSPRFWNGMTLGEFMRLAGWRLRDVSPSRWHMWLIVFVSSVFNSLLAVLQKVMFGRRIRNTALPTNPVFVIGHFRTGTTMLLEHLACDPQFVWPTTYQCFAPRHFLVTQSFIPSIMRWLMPRRRPMDNMDAGFDRPQEDEFAMLSMAAPTIYQRIAFPNQPAPYLETLRMENCDRKIEKRWLACLTSFYQAVMLKSDKRLLVKSPAHTGRIEYLLKLFPDARFVHIVRNPIDVFPSLQNAWRVLDVTQGFEAPDNDKLLDDTIFETLNEMYRGYWQAAKTLSPQQLFEVKYEDLIANPIDTMRAIYQQLELGEFEAMHPGLEARLASLNKYRTNRFEPDPEVASAVRTNWADYQQRFDYETT